MSEDRFEEAETAFRQAVHICERTLPPAAGSFRASLALLLSQLGQFEEVANLFEVGERQVRTIPAEYVRFLCKKGQACYMAGDTEGSQEALKQAKQIAKDHHFSGQSEVSQSLVELESLLVRYHIDKEASDGDG